jgi:ATP-dependent Clp protease ATP-binding subunit ClpC
MLLPVHLIYFWYVDGIQTLIRTWRNILFLIEEDMAVSLMWRLLFTPLFHDASFVGRILSLIFRLVRIFSGIITMLFATAVMGLLTVVWLVIPGLFVITLLPSQFPILGQVASDYIQFVSYVAIGGVIFGLSLFLQHIFHHPIKKIWQITSAKDLYQASNVKKSQIGFKDLIQTTQVQKLLASVELDPSQLPTASAVDSSKLAQTAFELAKQRHAPHIAQADFFMAYLKLLPEMQHFLIVQETPLEAIMQAQNYLEEAMLQWRKIMIWDEDFHTRHLKGVNRGWLSAPTPALDAISEDLTQAVYRQNFEDFIGRKDILSQVLAILSQDNGRNVLLVGEPGSGKSTLVRHLAKLIVAGDAPDILSTKRIVQLDSSRLLAGVNNEGEMAQVLKAAFTEIKEIGDIIVYIDEIHELGIGDAGKNFNIYALLTPYLESNEFQFISSTESSNYARIIEREGSLARLFHKVEVPEASLAETLEILKSRAIELEIAKGIKTTFSALAFMAQKSKQFIHDRSLPDSALYLFQECQTQATSRLISTDTVKSVLSRQINVPIVDLDASQKELLLQLEPIIHQRMIGQDQAVKVVSDTLRRAATAMREENRPIGSFLFVGPTGVGKTELAKILAEVYFKQHQAFVRFDMSEYQTSEAVNRLLGTSENPGELTEIIKNKPYCLILLDEFEKANPQILTLFLQILEDGRLTGGDSQTVDFTNTIIIATSNAGSLTIAHGLSQEKPLDLVENDVRQELLTLMKPELVNRFDSIVIFKPLSQFDLEKIVLIKLAAVRQHLIEQGYVVDFSKELITELARRGYDPVLGARPLRRLIQDTLEANISKMILKDELKKGESITLSQAILNN